MKASSLKSAAAVLFALSVASSTLAAEKLVTFLSCPIYRDTDLGRKSGCWLADDPASGIRYDVTDGPTKPQVGHVSLFEGIVTDEPNTCGGVVLKPVRSAVLEETCPVSIIPAEEFPGRKFILPQQTLQQTWIPRELPRPPFAPEEFNIVFDFDHDFLIYQYAELIIEKMSLFAKASHAKSVEITGYAATQPLRVSDRQMVEPLSLAKARAEMVALALSRVGIDRSQMKITWRGDPQPLDGLPTPGAQSSKRRVTIRIIPGD